MRIAVLAKQVPRGEAMALGPDGRLTRDGVELEMNAYCRRAVSQGVALAAAAGGSCTVYSLGPPSAEDVLREAVAWGADEGVLVTDPAFAGSDTLATARALAAALRADGPFDLVLAGRNSLDADTGQVGPELAELLGLPLVAGVRALALDGDRARCRCELDDGWREVTVGLPAVLTCAERLIEPCKVDPAGRAAVAPSRLRTVSARRLGPGPWGQAASLTTVGRIRVVETARRGLVLSGPVAAQVDGALAHLREWGALEADRAGRADETVEPVADPTDGRGPAVAVLAEPGRPRVTRELLGEAARLAVAVGGPVVAVGPGPVDPATWGGWGADAVVELTGTSVEEDVAAAVGDWLDRPDGPPWALLAPGTLWGREVAGRVAARLDVGLTGDAVGLGVDGGRLVAWKPAFGGRLVAAVTASSPLQAVTVRPGVLPRRRPRRQVADPPCTAWPGRSAGRVVVHDGGRDDEVEALLAAERVVCVGQGVPPDRYRELDPLLVALGAELAGSRKVTDRGWLPRSRQVGVTGHSLAPALFVALGLSGKFNHMAGTRGAGTVLAVNTDRDALVFSSADVGIVADWGEAVHLLAERLGAAPAP